MRDAQVDLATRRFVGWGLHEARPDRSARPRIRHCWGADMFRRVFVRVVQPCPELTAATYGLVFAATVHIDASLIRADVSMNARGSRHLDAIKAADGGKQHARRSGKFKTLCRMFRTRVASMCATGSGTAGDRASSKAPLRPACKPHTAVDDREGGDVEIGIGQEHDTCRFEDRLAAIEDTPG